MDHIAENLKRIPMLAGLKPDYLDMLAKLATLRTYRKGEVIIHQGDPGTGLFVILNGSVSVTSRSRPGLPEKALASLNKGEWFGEMSLIDGYPRSATVTTLAETEVAELNRWVFLDALRREPSIAVAMLPELCRRIRNLEESRR